MLAETRAPGGTKELPPAGPPRAGERLGGPAGRAVALAAGTLLLCAIAALSLFAGVGQASPTRIIESLLAGPGAAEGTVSTIVYDMRLPRMLTAVIVGAALGVAGAIMQALISNPLADPGILGVNSGAGLAVVIAVGAIGLVSFERYVWFALAGALLVSLVVYALSLTIGRGSPLTVLLAGVAISAVLTGISTALAILDPARFNALRGWMSGTVAGRDLATIGQGGVVILCGIVVGACFARPLAQLALGDETAQSLGVRVGATRFGAAIAIMLLAGGATALAGPILFVGLMVPHLARLLAGQRLGWSLAFSAIAGAMLVLVADIAGRFLIPPGEAPAGLLTALIGAPVLALLARGGREGEPG